MNESYIFDRQIASKTTDNDFQSLTRSLPGLCRVQVSWVQSWDYKSEPPSGGVSILWSEQGVSRRRGMETSEKVLEEATYDVYSKLR